jgi:Domain of unknown function (DUF4260)
MTMTSTGTRANESARSISSVRLLLHTEGAAAGIAGIALYIWAGGEWLWLVPLMFVPDVSMVGYAFGSGIGSDVYNAVHNWALGLAVLGLGLWLGATPRCWPGRSSSPMSVSTGRSATA